MLADQWLWYADGGDQLIDAAMRFEQLQHDGDPHRCAQGAQDLAGAVEDVAGRRGRRGVAVLMAGIVLGVGLAWLVLGRKAGPSLPEPPLAGTKYEALSRWEDEGGPPAPLRAFVDFIRNHALANARKDAG